MMESGDGLPNPQPDIAARYYRIAANSGNEDAEIELAEKLLASRLRSQPENGSDETATMLRRAFSQGSARAALRLAQMYREGGPGVEKDPRMAIAYAYKAIDLSVKADPTKPDGSPYYEFAAGILLAEMATNNEAQDVNGHPLLNPDEVARLQKYYGAIDPETHRVKVRLLEVPLNCWGWTIWKRVWVWDWGRKKSPTEPQFRNLERDTSCFNNDVMRRTLSASFELAKKDNVPFADLIDQQIKSAVAQKTNAGKSQKR